MIGGIAFVVPVHVDGKAAEVDGDTEDGGCQVWGDWIGVLGGGWGAVVGSESGFTTPSMDLSLRIALTRVAPRRRA